MRRILVITVFVSSVAFGAGVPAAFGSKAGVTPGDAGTVEIYPVFRGNVTTQQVFEASTGTFSSGSRAVSFNTPFSAVPICVCSDTGGSVLACATGTPTASGVTFFGTLTDTFNWICVGPK